MIFAMTLAAALASVFAFTLGALDIGLIFAIIAGAVAMGIDGK